MLQIRRGMFETNSSSANVLTIPKDQGVHVPKRFIFMDDDTSLRPIEIVLTHLIGSKMYNRPSLETITQIVNFIYQAGVEEIVYGGPDHRIQEIIDTYKDKSSDQGVPNGWGKESLLLALFGTETECEYYRDGETRPNYGPGPEYKQLDSDENNWYREYYAD
jgi:hypothetical protein